LSQRCSSSISNKDVADLDKDIFKILVPEGQVAGYVHKGKWFPIDTIEKYVIANAYWNK